jgi:predicted O-methyltransferase YrrM
MQYPNWFGHYAQGFFARHLAPLAGRPGLRFLQVGAFTGDASVWLLDNILTDASSELTDVDTWEGSDEPEHDAFDFADVERVYDERTAKYVEDMRLIKYVGCSRDFFQAPAETCEEYDFIYIDGAHTAADVLSDAVRAYPTLKVGGLLAFDDYLWKSGKGRLHDPAPAIDAFIDLHSDRIDVIDGGLQVWVRRTA